MTFKNLGKEKSMVTLEIEVGAEAFADAVMRAYKKVAQRFNVPGFRKGKAPKGIIEKMYGKEVFYDEAINIAYPGAYDSAIEEAKLEPVGQPDLEILEIDENGFKFKAVIPVKPEVTVGEYKGLSAEKVIREVNDSDIDTEIERMRQQGARIVEVDREVKNDDTVILDYEGSVDGVPFNGGKAEGHQLKIGSNQFIPGFEEAIIGHKAGEKFDIDVTFPEEYHAPDLAGKKAVFAINLTAVKETQLSELDDEFAKDVSEFETLKELKEDIKKRLSDAREIQSTNEMEDKLIAQITDSLEGDIPEVMFESEQDEIVRDFSHRLKMQGLDLETYVKYTGGDMNKFRDSFKGEATRRVRTRLALEKVAAEEKIEISDEKVEEEYKRLSDNYGMELEKVRSLVPANNIKLDLAVIDVVKLIRESAKIKEVPFKEEEKEEKKAPAKKAKAESVEDKEEKPAKKTAATKKASPSDKASEGEEKPKTAKKTKTTKE